MLVWRRAEARLKISPWKLYCGSSFCPPQPPGELMLLSFICKQLGVPETFTHMWGKDRKAQGLGLRIKHTGPGEKYQGKGVDEVFVSGWF